MTPSYTFPVEPPIYADTGLGPRDRFLSGWADWTMNPYPRFQPQQGSAGIGTFAIGISDLADAPLPISPR